MTIRRLCGLPGRSLALLLAVLAAACASPPPPPQPAAAQAQPEPPTDIETPLPPQRLVQRLRIPVGAVISSEYCRA